MTIIESIGPDRGFDDCANCASRLCAFAWLRRISIIALVVLLRLRSPAFLGAATILAIEMSIFISVRPRCSDCQSEGL